jgi:hypothetical protein
MDVGWGWKAWLIDAPRELFLIGLVLRDEGVWVSWWITVQHGKHSRMKHEEMKQGTGRRCTQ